MKFINNTKYGESSILGKKFGLLTPLERSYDVVINNSVTYKCQCDCGSYCYCAGVYLAKKKVVQCSICKRERISKLGLDNKDRCGKSRDLSGMRFGNLVVLEVVNSETEIGVGNSRIYKWRCVCDCGNIIIRAASSLRGLVKLDCGCGCCGEKITYANKHNLIAHRYYTMKDGAPKRGYVVEITASEFAELAVKPCSYCGREVEYSSDGKLLTINGLDRIDNKQGYLLDNVTPCCSTCNLAKRSMSVEEFMLWIKRVYNYNFK